MLGSWRNLTSKTVPFCSEFSALSPNWRLIAFSGVIGLLAFTPVALELESLFPLKHNNDAPSGFVIELATESIQAAPAFLLSWFLLNFESVTPRSIPPEDSDAPSGNQPPEIESRLPGAI
ncbi:MAG: hypothetical protein AAF578_13105 [Pseudomonadota bacterium]